MPSPQPPKKSKRRAERIHHLARVRAKLSTNLQYFATLSPRQIGVMLSTHGRPCSCSLCKATAKRPQSPTPTLTDYE